MPKLTKREQERAAAALAGAQAESNAAATPSYDHPPSSEEIASLFTDTADAAFEVPAPVTKEEGIEVAASMMAAPMSRHKRCAEEAFGGGGDTMSVASSTTEADDVSRSSKSTATSSSSRPRKTPTRPAGGASAATPGSADKSLKGLRHFSLKVCRKVEEKGRTNYNEVADELVAEVLNQKSDPSTGAVPVEGYDEKNIRRRVYDALNVLMAMDIISKEKKEIRWKGLPSNAQHDLEVLNRDKRRLEQSLNKKKELLQELILQRIAFQRLMRRNEVASSVARAAPPAGSHEDEEQRKIPLPFIIINTHSQTVIQCEMTEDRSDVFFNFSAPFEIGT